MKGQLHEGDYGTEARDQRLREEARERGGKGRSPTNRVGVPGDFIQEYLNRWRLK